VGLSGAASYAGGDDDSIVTYQWSQLSGPSVSLSDPSAISPTFTAPTVSPGGADLVFQLTVVNSNGLSNSAAVTVHTSNPGDPVTVMELTSDAGDPVGQGQAVSLNDLNAVFNVGQAEFGGTPLPGVQLVATTSIAGILSTSWTVQMSAPLG